MAVDSGQLVDQCRIETMIAGDDAARCEMQLAGCRQAEGMPEATGMMGSN